MKDEPESPPVMPAAPPPAADPVAAALADPAVRGRLLVVARAQLRGRCAALPPTERLAEAEAVVHEAVARALERRERYDGTRPVEHWLNGIVRNVVRERARQWRREARQVPLDDRAALDLAADPARPAAELLAIQSQAEQLLARLAPLDRQVVELRFFEDLTHDKIAGRLGMTRGAVALRLHRAIHRLQRLHGAAGEGQS